MKKLFQEGGSQARNWWHSSRIIFSASLFGTTFLKVLHLLASLSKRCSKLLTSFYQLDDEARKEVVETIQFKLQYHKDAERAEQIKQIKGW